MPVSLLRDLRFRAHDQGREHPESPARLDAIDAALAASPSLELLELPAREATREEILAVHTPALLERLERARGARVRFDPDTATSAGSVDAALLAAGSTAELFSRVARGEAPPGMALPRPPGHHATPDRIMGFCLLNNAAIGARALLDAGLAERVVIYDWDVHHGNGTQDAFYEDPRVLYISTHQAPFYPGTGGRSERGRGAGEGTTLNVPLPAGTDDETLLALSREHLIPAARAFAPDFVVISAGFDPFEDDPLGGFAITTSGFRALAGLWRDFAEAHAKGKIAGVLEGGYDLPGLGACVREVLEAWDT